MKLVPAPLRQFKTYTMLLGIFIGSFDAAILLIKALSDLHVMSTETVLAVNAVLGFLIVPAKLIRQYIPATVEQKTAVVESAAATPMHPGEPNIAVTIDDQAVPSTPADLQLGGGTRQRHRPPRPLPGNRVPPPL